MVPAGYPGLVHFTRPRDLVGAGLVGLVLGYLLLQLIYAQLPGLPLFAGVTLGVLALAEFVFAFQLRARIHEGRMVQPLTAARAVALAKASSLLGAIMLGVWLGVLGYLLPRSGDLIAAQDDTPSAVIGLLCAGLLIGAALWLEHCCRTPKDRRQDKRHPSGSDE
ncbi:uncharacterized protein DUF3180 [Tamaricihabitans halophyticus]|uniref:Uncharacterized protein DUF3180 n=1 Tax=Tamaricihabitans halophyticus TaxID=1262583 RepID=A0A4R2R4T5_9PSEU|nr:uncharacterized protein DUF3180 [Tamaricihabitans halophyticus]